jgi:hypothetical protein
MDKLKSLLEYKAKLEARQTSPIPDKHKNRPSQFKEFLNHELQLVNSQIAKLKEGK